MSPPVRYAVLFKTHFWDDFAERQFRRLCLRSGNGDVYVVVDETNGVVRGIDHDNVIRMTDSTPEADGYLAHPKGKVFWYNTDYQIYHFFDLYPQYDFVFSCEYDCVVNFSIGLIINAMVERRLDFVGEPIRTSPDEWRWTPFARPYYASDLEFSGRLVCCAAFSQRFARQLQAARRAHCHRMLRGEILQGDATALPWPNNEAFVGAEIAQNSIAEASLSEFGDTSHYNWAPPHPEFALSELPQLCFAHPVLDAHRYLHGIKKIGWDISDLFVNDSPLQRAMDVYDPRNVIPMFLQYFVERQHYGAIDQLRDYACNRCGSAARKLFNVARGKPATQSSVSPWSRAPTLLQDASGAVSGIATGHYGFHTNLDEQPWWCVDLEAVYPVREIRIFNRLDQPSRSRKIIVSGSSDMVHWYMILERQEDTDFGGADGNPLKIEFEKPIDLRFLRVHLPTVGLLHLDEVELYI